MFQQAGIWEYDPFHAKLSWKFAAGVSFEALTGDERRLILVALHAAADPRGSGIVAQELQIRDPGEETGLWIALYGRRVEAVGATMKVAGIVLDVSDRKAQAVARDTVINELEHCIRERRAPDGFQGADMSSPRNSIDIRVGRAITKLRRDVGLSVFQLSALLGVDPWQLALIEAGRWRASASLLLKVGQYFRVSTGVFYGGSAAGGGEAVAE